MWSAGKRLCGYSMRKGAVHDFSTKSPNQPPTAGRAGQASLSGSNRKKTAAVRIEKTTLRAKTRISRLLWHKKGAMKKNRSIDMYGTISRGTYGMTVGSHAKYQVFTASLERCAVNQLVLP